MKKGWALLSILCLLFVGFNDIKAQSDKSEDNGASDDKIDELFTQSEEYQEMKELIDEYSGVSQLYDADGNEVEEVPLPKSRMRRSVARAASDYSVSYGIVDFYSNRTGNYIEYIDEATGLVGYLGGTNSGAYLGKDAQNRIRFKMSGVVGAILPSYESQVAVYGDVNHLYTSFYRVESGKLWHYINYNNAQNLYYKKMVGYAQDVPYLTANVNYFSYDGHYFYQNEHQMYDDYKANTYAYPHAVNAGKPYYNYFQYLTHRASSNYSAQEFDAYTNDIVGSAASQMKGLGTYYVSYGQTYGVNALMAYAVSCNESAYGKSEIAMTKNNLFGHAAYDSSPGASANPYPNPQYSIYVHMHSFISRGYLDPGDYRYNGGHLGDKASGVGLKYASDPWWGETAAAIMYAVDEYNGKKDYKVYTVGIKENSDNVNIRKEPNTSSTVLYRTGKNVSYPFVILDSVKGETVNGSDVWYKIQTDPNLNASRTGFDTVDNNYNPDGDYDKDNSYAYIHSSYVKIVSEGNGQIITPSPSYLKGDVNGDGKISSMDYVLVKDHILKITTLSGSSLSAADVNGDGKISSMDYVLIKDHILGINLIKQ
ncbi:dockerin type I domain-containing protein [Massilicoli timonensis]|uniref:dockerin type I domain-containing protein n=1 Tax=Massilicoli timonensis TaxID=2015901 RepID=UPI000C84B0E9|nr:dockerin type I domain-containing protein [Massilicoli timonensis]